jgi:hypothetical protein
MLKFLKMMVAEDVTIMAEAQAEVLAAEEVRLQEEKEVLLQEEKVLADSEATEAQLHVKVDLVEEVLRLAKVVLAEEVLLQERVVFHLTEHQKQKVRLKELQEDPKDLVKRLVQKDQEEANKIC